MGEDDDGIRHLRSLRKMLYIQKDEAYAQIKQEVADLQQKLLKQLDTAFEIKLVELKKLEEKVQSCSLSLNPLHFFSSIAVKSLLSLDCLKVSDFECTSFAYINACEAKPDQLHFVDDYSARVSNTGDTVRVYYMCSLDYDPVLFKFLTVLVKDAANNDISLKHCDLGNGCYMLEFRACEEGSFLVCVKVYGQNISGSPVVISIQNGDSVLLPELSRSDIQGDDSGFPFELTQSGMEVTLPELSQTCVEVTLPKLSRSCVKRRMARKGKSALDHEEVVQGTVSADLVLEFKAYSKNDYLNFPIGVTATSGGNIIVGDTGNHRVIVFNAEGRPLCKAALPGTVRFRRPSAVVALDDGSFAVKDDRCVYLFSKAGEYIRTLGKDSLVRPFGKLAYE
ncbi:hypothetical protein IscW_ISCW020206 [Ixodes scapularis]|uniref:Uncharacterized protein n=1 Tax=Ixodes scapularis TaxID=6945 RepID=B7Q0E4_IXOSC|nr:hypothetical protein IscW_ISCW020206 [Ixodes scapularis]|eukprot:XP_002407473.1 hypothetical protein IscW_ISCW020206 [Ixodes scapularis]